MEGGVRGDVALGREKEGVWGGVGLSLEKQEKEEILLKLREGDDANGGPRGERV